MLFLGRGFVLFFGMVGFDENEETAFYTIICTVEVAEFKDCRLIFYLMGLHGIT
jgi:hypothetical protein